MTKKTRDEISVLIFGKPFNEISLKDCQIVNTRYFAQDKEEG